MEEIQIKTSDVTDFLEFCIDTSMDVYSVDDKGYVVFNQTEKRHVLGSDKRELILYQQEIGDNEGYIVNPFSESMKPTPPDQWLFSVLCRSFEYRVFNVLQRIAYIANEDRKYSDAPKKPKKAPPKYPSVVSRIASKIVKKVDDKFVEEVDKLAKEKVDLIKFLYSSRMQTHRIMIPLFEEDMDDYPKSIRKQSYAIIETILKQMFGITDPEDIDEYTCKAREGATCRIDSLIQCLYKAYRQLNELFDVLSHDSTTRMSVDLTKFKAHVDRMVAYSRNAKGMISYIAQPAKDSVKQSDNTMPLNGGSPYAPGAAADGPRTIPGSTVPMPSDGSGVPLSSGYDNVPSSMYDSRGYIGRRLPVADGYGYGHGRYAINQDPYANTMRHVPGADMGDSVHLSRPDNIRNITPGLPRLHRY